MNLTKKIFTLLILIGLISCNKEEVENIELKDTSSRVFSFNKDNTTINYTGKIIDNELIINFNVNNSIKETFKVDLNNITFSENIANQITNKQRKLSKKFSLSEINNLVSIMDEMVETKTRSLDNKELKDIKTQGLFICNSLIKSINRLIKHNNSQYYRRDGDVQTTNTVYKGFDRELSSFALDEDIVVDVQDYINYIDQNPEFSLQKGFTFVKEILENKSSSTISLTELQNDILQFTLDNPDMFEGNPDPNTGYRWPQGSDHGCCGNYSGNCWYWHPVCWVHDKMCTDCTPRWFCFSGCVPD